MELFSFDCCLHDRWLVGTSSLWSKLVCFGCAIHIDRHGWPSELKQLFLSEFTELGKQEEHVAICDEWKCSQMLLFSVSHIYETDQQAPALKEKKGTLLDALHRTPDLDPDADPE